MKSKESSKKTELELLVKKHAKAKEITFVNMKISPADAEYILESNSHNRSISERLVTRFSNTMAKKGRWVLNGECLKIAKNGRLLDGQHRLLALHSCGCTIPMTVCLGLDEKMFQTLDTGRARSAGDILHAAGYKNWNLHAAAARYLSYYRDGEGWQPRKTILSPQDILETARRFPKLEQCINPAYRLKHVFSSSIAAFFIYLVKSIDDDLAWEFFLKIETGQDLKKGDPILQFREVMLKYRAQKLMPDKRVTVAMLIETWNAYYYDEEAPKGKWDGSRPFPMIAGINRKKLFG